MDEKDFTFDEENQLEEVEENLIEYGSENWENHVISQFLPHELYNGEYPTLNGLRRITLITLGKVVSSKPILLQTSLPGAASCIYEIIIDTAMGRLCFAAAADATQENISGAYHIYPTAIAESRAEARAYRKALMLTTVSAEEIKGNESSFNSVIQSGILQTDGVFNESEPMSQQQEKLLKIKTSKLGINLDKFYEFMKIDKEKTTKQNCLDMFNKINEFQSQEKIPEELL